MTDADDQIAVARAIAHAAHKGQTDKAGNPYIDHPRRVAERLSNERVDIIAAGWLHDVLEDSDLTRDDLHDAGIKWSVIETVELVTRTQGTPIEAYFEGIKQSYGARAVKIADIADNTDVSRMARLDDPTIVRLTRKYAKALTMLGAS